MIGFEITVHGKPVGQPRHRTPRKGRPYIPKDHPVHAFKQSIIDALPDDLEMTEEAVYIALTLRFPRAKSHTKKQRERVFHTQKPDSDNCLKAVMDCLTKKLCKACKKKPLKTCKVCVKQRPWKDDAQVQIHGVKKIWTDDPEGSTSISVWRAEP